MCAKRSRRRPSEAIEDSHNKRRYNLLRSARGAREEGHEKQMKIHTIKEDTTFFDVREAPGKKIIRSFSTSQTPEENYIFFGVREAPGKKVIRSFSWCRPS